MLYRLVYSSRATQQFWPEDLFRLVETSRRKNALRGVTGMLLCYEGQFLQLLEGNEAEVKAVYQLVQRDGRHENLQILLEGFTAKRDFPAWTMGFQTIDEVWGLPSAWATVLEEGFNSTANSAHPSAAIQLLLSFQNAVQATSGD